MRVAVILIVSLLAFAVAPAPPALGAVGAVRCCVQIAIDDAPERPACIVLRTKAKSRARAKARARQICRLIGGRPAARGAQ